MNPLISIPFSKPFLSALASYVLKRYGARPDRLARCLILLPNRRSCQAFEHVLFDMAQHDALMMPDIRPIAEVGSELPHLPSAFSDAERFTHLAQLLLKHHADVTQYHHALTLAESLGQLLDDFIREGVELEKLYHLVPDFYAHHWQHTLDFLKLISHIWPKEQATIGKCDSAKTRHYTIMKQIEIWQKNPPSHPIIAAGTTGTIAATRELLRYIHANAPDGHIILQGLESWDGSEPPAPSHAQYGFYELCEHLQITPPKAEPSPPPSHVPVAAFPTQIEEAIGISYYVKEATGSMAVVTHDAYLASLIEAQLHYLGCETHNTFSAPLSHSAEGQCAHHMLHAAMSPVSPSSVLDVLRHPLVNKHEMADALEYGTFRKREPYRYMHLHECGEDAAWLSDALSPLQVDQQSLHHWVHATQHALESVIGYMPDTIELLLKPLASQHNKLCLREWASMLDMLMKRTMPYIGHHSSAIYILNPIEARLLSFDHIIIAGIQEGGFPTTPKQEWLNKSMRKAIGLRPIDAHIGQAAHDFAQLIHHPNILLTYAQRVGEQPANPSPFIAMLPHTHTTPLYAKMAKQALTSSHYAPCTPPQPSPPVRLRPNELSVTQIETLLRDPYAFYAAKMLGLTELDPIDPEPDPALFGSFIHSVLEHYYRTQPRIIQADDLIAVAKPLFDAQSQHHPSIKSWWPRVKHIAESIVEHEHNYSPISYYYTEHEGQLTLENGMVLKARADRIDICKDGNIRIIDYKTGQLPTYKEMELGLSPQLVLEGLMATKGAFANITTAPEHIELCYYATKPNDGTLQVVHVSGSKWLSMLENAEEGLSRLLHFFAQESVAYRSAPHPLIPSKSYSYKALARADEWR